MLNLYKMRNKFTLLCLLLCCNCAVEGQSLLISCSTERNADNSISIIGQSQAYGTYTVRIIFSSLLGYHSPFSISNNIVLATIESSRKELLKCTQDKYSVSYSFQYRYQYYPGTALRKQPDTSFLYLLPASPGNTVRISQVSSLAARLGQKKANDYSGTGFVYKQGDTICAARAGLVYDANDGIKEAEKNNEFYKSVRNRLSIQQRDGSICTYDILAPIHLLIQPGEIVLPGTPLAVFNQPGEKYIVLLSTYYLDEKQLLTADENNPSSACTVYMPTHFYCEENNGLAPLALNQPYTARHPANIIASELSKKEKKRLGLQQ
jgi:hypothetical protein